MTGKPERQLTSLISEVCDGAIDESQQRELDQMLRDSAECRRIYLQYLDMHARLTVHPHLATGIPFDRAGTEKSATAPDLVSAGSLVDGDRMVLERARMAVEYSADHAQPLEIPRRRMLPARFILLTLLLLVAVLGWRTFDGWRDGRGRPVIQEMLGDVTIRNSSGLHPAQAGHRLAHGEQLATGEDDAHAELRYDDGTRIVVSSNSAVEVPSKASGVHLRLRTGTVDVDAAPQPADRPLIFATDHARYVVLGTRFRLYRETEASRLELSEGKVRLERQVDGESLDVAAGFAAVAGTARTPLEVQPLATAHSRLRATLSKAGQTVAFSPDGNWLATADWGRGLKTWHHGETTPRDTCEGKIGRSSGLAVADRTLVHVSSEQRQASVVLWDPGIGHAATAPLADKNVRSRALSPDGNFLVESNNDGTQVHHIELTKAQLEPLAALPGPGKAWCLSLSHAAQFAAAGFWDGTVRVYDVSQAADPGGGIVFERKLKHTPIHIALSGDGRRLAVFSHQDGLLLIELSTGGTMSLWGGSTASVTCLKFTPDGSRLMAGLSDSTARMWSADDGQPLIVIDAGHVPRDIAWSEHQSCLATANGNVHLWECEFP